MVVRTERSVWINRIGSFSDRFVSVDRDLENGMRTSSDRNYLSEPRNPQIFLEINVFRSWALAPSDSEFRSLLWLKGISRPILRMFFAAMNLLELPHSDALRSNLQFNLKWNTAALPKLHPCFLRHGIPGSGSLTPSICYVPSL